MHRFGQLGSALVQSKWISRQGRMLTVRSSLDRGAVHFANPGAKPVLIASPEDLDLRARLHDICTARLAGLIDGGPPQRHTPYRMLALGRDGVVRRPLHSHRGIICLRRTYVPSHFSQRTYADITCVQRPEPTPLGCRPGTVECHSRYWTQQKVAYAEYSSLATTSTWVQN